MSRWLLLIALCAVQSGCKQPAPAALDAVGRREVVTLGNHAETVGDARIETSTPRIDFLQDTYWPVAKLESGQASISCDYDYNQQGDGSPITSLEFFSLVDALSDCQPSGVVRLRYKGTINAGFTELVQRVSAMATRMDIDTRILDINSTGGHVEQAIRAGDTIAESNWDIWVREASVCHSACVLILAAGDTRSIAGKVGIHRLIRDQSNATSRAELNDELRATSAQVHEYLGRNGVATAVADLMMTIANRDLRLLSDDELKQYGLAGTNAAQDDLDRIRTRRKCGEAFVRRKDAFGQAFDRQCMEPGKAFESRDECGLALRKRYGFPDRKCAVESPLSEYDRDKQRVEALSHERSGGEGLAAMARAPAASPASIPPARR
ncbi:MAG: COG3904 family protein [Lysobacter sp.]